MKKKKQSPDSIAEISRRMRGFLLDSQVNHAHEVAVLLGCSVMSDEVAIKEEEESDKRVDQISHLIPLVFAFAHIMAEGATEYQRTTITSEEAKSIPSEVWVESRKVMENSSFSAILGSLSQLLDMGLITIPKKKRRMR